MCFPEGIKVSPDCPEMLSVKTKKSNDYDENIYLLIDDFLKIMNYKLHQTGLPLIPNEVELDKLKLKKQEEFLSITKQCHQKISSLLPIWNKDEKDAVIITHKKNNSNATENDKYNEINQSTLISFIKSKFNITYLKSNEQKTDDNQNLEHLVHAYNLQFRLSVYIEMLSAENKAINFIKLKEDLDWCDYLILKIESYLLKNEQSKKTSMCFNR